MPWIRSSHATLVGLALLVACTNDADSDGGSSSTGEGSTGAMTSTSGSTSDAETTSAESSGSGTTTGPGDSSTSAESSSSSSTGGPELAARASRYLEMSDGTRIAVDIWLPESALDGDAVPTVMRMTRYWRAMEWGLPMFDESPEEAAQYTDHGFAYVTVDARGSGASFGSREGPWAEIEREDHGEVVDWLVGQSWSNGNVGAVGVSYDGNTAAFLATSGRSAVKAVVPRFYDSDPYDSPGVPGGVYNDRFVQEWAGFNNVLDAAEVCALAPEEDCATVEMILLGPKWADEDPKGALAAEAIAEHAENLDVYQAGLSVTFRDDAFAGDASFEDISLIEDVEALDRGGAAVYGWASWFDAGTADSALNVFSESEGSHRVIIGAWNHGADEDADPYLAPKTPVSPSEEEQQLDIIDFFTEHLATDAAPQAAREIRYYTVNEGTWRTTDVWPPADVTPTTMYFAEGTLVEELPAAEASEDYAVDYTATTGASNRWLTQLDGDVVYPDRAEEDGKLLTYTGAPLTEDTRLTGSAEVTVHFSTTHDDGALFAYLEDVAPDGSVTYLAEGQLRLVHRAVDVDSPTLHSFSGADGQPVVPDETMEVRLRLRPTSARIEAGHRIRIALAGADIANFARYPAEGDPTWTVRHGGSFASHVVLPVASAE